MRRCLQLRLSPAAILIVLLVAALTLTPLPWGWLLPLVADAHEVAPRIASGGAFGSAVACLSQPDQLVATREANTLSFHSGSRLSQSQALDLPAVQALTAGGAGAALAAMRNVGAVYGLAYDDGRASGRERLFVAAFTKRLAGYGPAGAGGIYVLQRVGAGWSLLGSLAVPGAVAASHTGAHDIDVVPQVGKTSLGDLEVSPDGRSLFVVNIGPKRIERFALTGGAIPAHQGSIPINLDRISASPTVKADLWPFALEFYPFAANATEPILVVGVTDSAERGIVGGRPLMSGLNFVVSPQAHVLVYNLATGWWGRDLTQDLGNSLPLSARHEGSTFGEYGNWNHVAGNYLVKAWNPWRGVSDMAADRQTIYYPQPLLTDIEFLSNRPAPGAPAWDTPLMVLGLRDRTGDQVFNDGISTSLIPGGEKITVAQGDTLYYRYQGGAWTFGSAEAFDDNTHYGGPNAHIENHMGALASVLNDRTGVDAVGETLATTALGGLGTQEVRFFERAAGPSASGAISARPQLIGIDTHAASKASNLGDLELLCAYALVGGRVWSDASYNSMQDAGEAGIPGVALEVFDNSLTPASAPALATATSDSQGRYLFAVPPNTPVGIRIAAASRAALAAQGYRITRQNQGGSDTVDSDASQAWGYIEFAPPGSTRTGSAIAPPWRESEGRFYDIGLTRLQPTGTIGDRVWGDGDGDGIQDAGEPGIAGVNVALESSGGTVTLVGVSTSIATDSIGRYRFRDLAPGIYRVRFGVPLGMRATLRDQGGDDTRDSDTDGALGHTTPDFTLDENQTDMSRDFGLLASVDMEIAKSGPATAAAGQSFSYTLVARNRSAAPADGVVVADSLPAGLSYVSAIPAPSSRSGQSLTWALGTMAGNASQSIVVNVRAATSFTPAAATTQTITNCATISTSLPDTSPGNNSACAPTTLQRPEVRIIKSAPPVALVGEAFTYELRYENRGAAAANVTLSDPLPAGLTFIGFTFNGGPCGYSATNRAVVCTFGSLPPGVSDLVRFSVRAEATIGGASVTNSATISCATPGDDPGDNLSSATTSILFPDPELSLRIGPRPLPVGEPGTITATYRNAGTGIARSAVLTVTHDPGASLGAVPGGCAYSAASRQAICGLGDLAPGAAGELILPVRLPATPADAASFGPDTFGATAEIGAATPERPADQGDDRAADRVDVIRPNVYVTAAGPDDTARLAWGSGFVYDVGYGNRHSARPDLTRVAEGSALTITLPADVDYLAASVPPTSVSGQVLVWQLGTLAPLQAGSLRIAVRTDVPAGSQLHLEAAISTATPGDDPADNRAAVDTAVVRPPERIPAPGGGLRLAIHSELDPRDGGASETDAVYLTPPGAARIVWPAGEVLDFTPRLDGYSLEDPGWPFEHRARVVGWSVVGLEVNGRTLEPSGADSRGQAGCRPGDAPRLTPRALAGCAYAYVGAYAEGRSVDDFLPTAALREAELAGQAHLYWTQPPAPPMRDDVYLYTVSPLEPTRLTVEVEVEVWVINACPDFLIDPLGSCGVPVEMPEPLHATQTVRRAFEVTLLVPRSVVGPGQ
ncbi:MAG: DUF11 domain-containing protein [Chloroflexales bacterium]|nr:DUF11 domain-containing protein [Chloroflexales bacterium]